MFAVNVEVEYLYVNQWQRHMLPYQINAGCSTTRASSALECKVHICVVGGGGLAFYPVGGGDMWHDMSY